MIQETIQGTIQLAGWQQFITSAEVTASVVALALGWAGTEALKRLGQAIKRSDAPAWVYRVLAFTLTLSAALVGWPEEGVLPHPMLAGLVLATAAPTVYAVVIWLLRRAGMHELASIITGNRRVDVDGVRGAPEGIERRLR